VARNGDSFITSPLGNVFPTGWAFQRFSLTLKRSHYRTDTSFSGSGNPFVFWFYALGFFVFLSIGFITVLDAKQKRWYLGFLVLFVLSNLFMLQPWSLDNVKIINIYMFGATAVVALGLVKLFYLNQPPDQEEEEQEQAETVSGSSWAVFALYDSITTRLCEIRDHPFLRTTPIVILARVIVVLVVVSLCFSGVLSVIRERNLHWQFQDSEDMATAQWIIEHTKPSAVFATSESHIIPASTNAGRQQVAGYGGWLSTHAYSGWQDRLIHVKEIWAGTPAAYDRLKEYKVSYLLRESNMDVSEDFLSQCCTEVFRSPTSRYILYQVKKSKKDKRGKPPSVRVRSP